MGRKRQENHSKKQRNKHPQNMSKKRQKQAFGLFLAGALVAGALNYFDGGLASSSAHQGEYSLQGLVVKVADGDTFTLLSQGQRHTIRVASIDAPETASPGRKGQPFGQAAKRKLHGLIANQQLSLSCYEQDHYGRDVCDVPLPDSSFTASQVLVESGLAWANQEKQGKFLRDKSLVAIEKQAKEQKRGLWEQPSPIAPWQWRYDCWRQKQCD